MREFIKSYFSSHNIDVTHFLLAALELNNKKTLKLLFHPIKNLQRVEGINGLLKEVATVVNNDDGERIFHNYLQELHGIYFVSRILKHKILAVENNFSKVLSPYCDNEKSCDLKSSYLNKTYFFESKDRSNLFTRDSNSLPITMSQEEESAKWIFSKANAANQKGAHFLICRPDLFMGFGDTQENYKEYFYGDWIEITLSKYFRVLSRVSKNEILVSPRENTFYPVFEGFFIVKEIGYIKVALNK